MKLKTKNSSNVIVPNKTLLHLQAHPEVMQFLEEAIRLLDLPTDNSFLRKEIEMGKIIGISGCVETPRIQMNELTLFAQRIERNHPSRVVYQEGTETSKISILAFPDRSGNGDYILITAWIGSLAPKEPWDPNIGSKEELEESIKFWTTHALVYNPSIMGEVLSTSWEEILK
jgi:hypothetical protein